MAANAVHRGRKVRCVFTRGRCSVVASTAVGGCRIQAVVGLSSSPSRCIRMASLAASSNCRVDGRRRLTSDTIGCIQVAGCTLGCERNIGMEAPGIPRRVTTLVTGVAIGNHHPCQGLVRYVVGRFAIRRWESPSVAGRTLVCHRHLRVIPSRRLPQRRCHVYGRCRMAYVAIGCSSCRNMDAWLTSGHYAVVARRACVGNRNALVVLPG